MLFHQISLALAPTEAGGVVEEGAGGAGTGGIRTGGTETGGASTGDSLITQRLKRLLEQQNQQRQALVHLLVVVMPAPEANVT